MDLDEEEGDDTFADGMTLNTTSELANNARRDMGLRTRVRSPSPAGSASSIEELERPRSTSRKNLKATPENVQLATMNAIKETMKMMKSVKRKRKESSSDSDDNHVQAR